MRYCLIIFLVLLGFYSEAQKLNRLGKIDVEEIPQIPDYRVEKLSGEYKIVTDSFRFDGNTYFSTPAGFITSLVVIDNEKDYVKQYGLDGKLIATILSDRIINLKVSKDGNKLAFFSADKIIHVNLTNYKVDSLQGSFVYEFTENNKFIYYDAENKAIWFDGNKIEIEEYPNQFIEYKNKMYVITKQNIYELTGNSLLSKYQFKGEFFDSKIIDDIFYFVDKEEKRKTESFSMYKTSDFQRIVLFDRLDDMNR